MDFLQPENYQPEANALYNAIAKRLKEHLPRAVVEHIGSSSITGLMSKGDLDIYVGVDQSDFTDATLIIEKLGFLIKHGSLRTECLCPFESHNYDLDVGVQLVVNRSAFENFLEFRDRLKQSETLRTQYNELKLRCSTMDEHAYRREKSEFIEKVLKS